MELNDIPKRAKNVAGTVADTAKVTLDRIRIDLAIAGEQKEIDKNCLVIGQWFVTDYEGEIPDSVKELVDAVNASKAKIAELEASKPVKPEPAPAEEEAAADEEVAAEEPAGKACPICGKVSNTRFCPHCGAPMGDD